MFNLAERTSEQYTVLRITILISHLVALQYYQTYKNLKSRYKVRSRNVSTMFTCEYPGCTKNCKTKNLLSSHRNTCHMGKVRPGHDQGNFKCVHAPMCSNTYQSVEALRRHHISRHTNQRFWCLCGLRFNYSSSLRGHIANSTEGKCGVASGIQPREQF